MGLAPHASCLRCIAALDATDGAGRVPMNAIKTIYGSRQSGAGGDGGRKIFRPYGEGSRMRISLLASML
jgi:hypothetical protein